MEEDKIIEIKDAQKNKPKKGFEIIYLFLPIILTLVSSLISILSSSLISMIITGRYIPISFNPYLKSLFSLKFLSYFFNPMQIGIMFVVVFFLKWFYEWQHKNDESDNFKSKKIKFVITVIIIYFIFIFLKSLATHILLSR